MDKYHGIRVLIPNAWQHTEHIDNFISVCKLAKEKHISVRWYLFGESNYNKYLSEWILQYRMYKDIEIIANINNLYRYVKEADIYIEWDDTCSLLKEAVRLNKPVYSSKYSDHCNTYLDHKIWSKDISELLKLIRETEKK
ncbi:glycosyltransferase [Gracilibacillus xinjiangensis]|uniref:Glycosyltransferase n=1 Tax=Gracilibacillus xinjiangensis TaxID=1193282 RepID=A0ABV8WUX6_9BACI